MQEFRDLGPHLINVTMSDDRIRVYALNFGIRFSDLTDGEKEAAYFSQRYLAEKYEKEANQLRKELVKKERQKVRVYVKRIRKNK
nr:MAG TPA: hypothetical protein [Caudoviricetes sp.]